MNLTNIVHNLPYTVKQPFKYIYSVLPEQWRLGKTFRDTYNFLQESQWRSKKELENYQMQQLSKLLHHAYENVPYYQKIFNERGLTPKDIQNFDDFKKLPYLTKEIIRDNLHDLTARNYPKSTLEYVTTGGSTGIPLGFYYEKGVSMVKEWAFMLAQWNRAGFKIGDKRVILRGIVENSHKFWRYNPLQKTLTLSSGHMTDETMPAYINKIYKFHPAFLHVYPSAITILAKFMKSNNIKPFPSIKAVLCGSENIYPWQRELLKEVFQCRIYSWYGQTEMCVLAGECEHSNSYHVFPEYGFVELLKNDGAPLTDEGELGEIIGTGFINYALPFIRYKTMDLAVYTNTSCTCGRAYPLLKGIEGRLHEFIVTPKNRLISMTAINMHSDVFDNVKQFMFYQDTREKVVLNIIKKATYTERDTEYIKRELYKKLGEDITLEVRFVEHIPPTKSGKARFLEQKLKIDGCD